MFNKIIKYANRQFRLFSQVSSVADGRINPQISTTDIIVSVLSMYFSNLGSLNKLEGALSLGTPTKITRPPSATTIGRSAGSMDLEHIREIGKNIYLKAKRSKMIEGYLGNSVGIIDGLELTSSSYPKCCHCKKRNVSKIEGVPRYQYYHQYVFFVLAGKKFTFILDIEPVLPGESEIVAAYRLLERVCINYPKAFSVVAGDGLYLAAPIFNLLLSHHKYSIAVLKDNRRQLAGEAELLSEISKPTVYSKGATTYRVWRHEVEGLWDSYQGKVTVIRSKESTLKRRHSKKKSTRWEYALDEHDWMWVTNAPSLGGLKNTVKICHSRWQIENQCFNELVNIWKASHIYRHSANAIMVFLLFLSIVVNIFNIFFARNIKDRKIKEKSFLIELIKASFLMSLFCPIPKPLPP